MKNYENYDPLFPDQPVVDLYLSVWSFLTGFKSKPAFIWVEENDTSNKMSFITYSQLNSSVSSISSQLRPMTQRGQTVVVLCSPGLELVQTIFACQRAGLVIVPIYPSLPSENNNHLIRVLTHTTPKAAIAHRRYITKIHQYISNNKNDTKLSHMLSSLTWIAIEDIIITDNDNENDNNNTKTKIKVNSPEFDFDFSSYNGLRQDELYLIQYTSGATSLPKPVMITAGSAAHNARAARRAYDLQPQSVIVSWLPQYHDCGLMFLLLTVVSGSTCVLTSPVSFIERPRVWLEMMSDFHATCSPVPAFALLVALKRAGIEEKGRSEICLSSLRNLIIVNEPIYRYVVEDFVNVFKRFGLKPSSVSPSYGLAENCTFVSTSWRPSHNLSDNDNQGTLLLPRHKKLLPVARLGGLINSRDQEEDVEIVVVNEETLEIVEDGAEGEILVSSLSNASGYLGHERLTDEVFRGRLVVSGQNYDNKVVIIGRCFVRTGDRGVVVVKGKERFLYVMGRCVDLIKMRDNVEIHAHYVETSAYKSCPRFLRGGCLAAFEVGEIVVVVAEIDERVIDNNNNNDLIMKNICEGIWRGVYRDEGIEVGLVVLVRSGCVLKTTSGKVKRWEAKERLVGGRLTRVLFKMPFGNRSMFVSGLLSDEKEIQSHGLTSLNQPSLLSLM